MAKEGYEPLPTSPVDYVDPSDSAIRKRSRSPLKQNWSKTRSVSPTQRRLHHELAADPRFHVPTPAPWKRVALLLFLAFLFYLAFSIRKVVQEPVKPKVVHAQRYSKDFKYRPAASPVVTERLKDGRVRVRGAMPTGGRYEPAQP